MDKYEFNIKVEQMRKMVARGDYVTAMKIVDTIDWKKVRNANLLSMVATIYEKNHEYQDAKDILLLAFERAPIGKRLLYKLTDLALKEGNLEEAEAYYREFCDLAGDDPRQHLLRYMILRQMDAPLEQQIHSLEGYTAEELDEKWLYELAERYHEVGDIERCVSTCDKIMLMFGLGKYVDKAMDLKQEYAPLNQYQMDLVENREKYEEKLRAVEQSFEYDDQDPEDSKAEVLRQERPYAVLEQEAVENQEQIYHEEETALEEEEPEEAPEYEAGDYQPEPVPLPALLPPKQFLLHDKSAPGSPQLPVPALHKDVPDAEPLPYCLPDPDRHTQRTALLPAASLRIFLCSPPDPSDIDLRAHTPASGPLPYLHTCQDQTSA